jgi:membrane associated rhomboid family serine protease
MIKKVLVEAYDKTFGVVWKTLTGYGKSFSNRTGWIQLFYLIVIVGFMAGLVSAVFFPVPNQGLVVYPSGGAQTIAETVIDAVVILFGGAGVYVAYLSGRQTTKPRMVNLYLGIALVLIFVSVFMGMELSILKG